DHDDAWADLGRLADRPDLPPRLAHHLAIIYLRVAPILEAEDAAAGVLCWKQSWQCWLRVIGDQSSDALLDYLLKQHRQIVADRLTTNDIEGARRHTGLVQQLPAIARTFNPALVGKLANDVDSFRDALA